MSNYRLTIVASGSGDEFELGAFPTLVDCTEALEALDDRYQEWSAQGFPELAQDDPLRHYEGCDAYATDAEGTVFVETGDDCWEEED